MQERERGWCKTGWVKELCVPVLCAEVCIHVARERTVRSKGVYVTCCVWKSCMRQNCMWKSCVWECCLRKKFLINFFVKDHSSASLPEGMCLFHCYVWVPEAKRRVISQNPILPYLATATVCCFCTHWSHTSMSFPRFSKLQISIFGESFPSVPIFFVHLFREFSLLFHNKLSQESAHWTLRHLPEAMDIAWHSDIMRIYDLDHIAGWIISGYISWGYIYIYIYGWYTILWFYHDERICRGIIWDHMG